MTVTNFVLFQAGWFACVLSAGYGAPWLGVLAIAAIVVWHVSRAGRPGLELALAAVCGFVGVLFEPFPAQ